jgi:periplasmic divalent cation tolerance protein
LKFIFIYITCKDEQEAKAISKHLLEKKFIACANFFPSKSMYHWKGKLTQGDEYILILKTTDDKFTLIKEEVKKLHSYEIPCITKISVDPNHSYGEWISNQL